MVVIVVSRIVCVCMCVFVLIFKENRFVPLPVLLLLLCWFVRSFFRSFVLLSVGAACGVS